jgi:hypothetical protein
VRAALKARSRAILVTTPANITWLTGYDMIWYHLKNLTGLLVRADSDDTLFFDSVAPDHRLRHAGDRGIVYVDEAAFPARSRKPSGDPEGDRRKGLAKRRSASKCGAMRPMPRLMGVAEGPRAGGAAIEDTGP